MSWKRQGVARLAMLAWLGLAACGSDREPVTPPSAPSSPGTRSGVRFAPQPDGCVEGITPLDRGVYAGMSVAHNYQHGGSRGYGTPTSQATLRELRELGVSWVSLTPFGFSRSLDESAVHRMGDRPEAENDTRMEAEIRAAHALGLRVFLKPHVWIAGGRWRGDIAPEDWVAWFASYREFIVHYATMAARLEVELFAVGVEFPTEGHEAEWREVIRAVRAVYEGRITFAANWDAFERVRFWADVDFVGVQFYPPLASEVGASEGAMRRALNQRLDALEAFGDRVQRPVLIAEVGYKSIEGTEIHPHTWPERHGRPTVSEAAQAQAYARLFEALHARRRIEGLFLWKWFTDPNTDEEGPDGFSVRGKRAEHVVRSGFLQDCRR